MTTRDRDVRNVLLLARQVVSREHTPRQLAINELGEKCEPLAGDAAAWSSAGAIIRVGADWDALGPQGSEIVDLAYLELEDAARAMGYPSPPAVDQAGYREVNRMFGRAITAVTTPPARRPRARPRQHGSLPKGSE